MASQAHLDKMQLRQNYRNLRHTDLMGTIQADTPLGHVYHTCFENELFTMICQGMYAVPVICHVVAGVEKVDVPNFAFALRYEIYGCHYSLFNYIVFLCFGNSVASTRFMLQDEFNIQTTKCDNCIIGFMFCLQQIACIFSIVAMIVGSDENSEASQLLSCLADMVYCSVCACMQTQHKIEMDKRDGMFGPQPVMAVPPGQHMSRIDQAIPPSAGYAPQPAYGQPYAYPPQPHGQGYPAYPPASAHLSTWLFEVIFEVCLNDYLHENVIHIR